MPQGPGEFLELIRSGEAATRGELLSATGMSRVSVALRVDALLEAGITRPAGHAGATGGRRAVRFVFDPPTLVLVAALDLDSGLIAAVDAHGSVMRRRTLDLNVADGAEATIRTITQGFTQLLEECGKDPRLVLAMGISLPAPIDPITGRPEEPPIMPGWDGWPVTEALQEYLDVPVYMENDADAMAYGEWSHRHGDPTRPLLLVKVADYIGGGIVIDGRVYRGVDGGAGDLGHIPVGGDKVCRCGRRGCLASEASGRAVLEQLSEQQYPVTTFAELNFALEQQDAVATAVVQSAGEKIGRVLGSVAAMLNPATIVIAGAMQSVPLVSSIRSAVYASALPRATRRLEISASAVGTDSALIGLARIALDTEYSPAAVNRRLGDSS
ncbi:ROK family protein [Myceligenerans indicum]|uniref:ROK family protein n=1 Tax=Myceligenerans indicum TaxID=2593663 RepID=A0ABS1LMR9_9MICO|nr:ROK family protein [Myceligenerans indicum]MBL0887506.1 ROK family protein [Myceligenerans indicum]